LLDYFGVVEPAFGKKLTEILPESIAGMIREKQLILRYKREDRSRQTNIYERTRLYDGSVSL
jgi:hypothetical protein